MLCLKRNGHTCKKQLHTFCMCWITKHPKSRTRLGHPRKYHNALFVRTGLPLDSNSVKIVESRKHFLSRCMCTLPSCDENTNGWILPEGTNTGIKLFNSLTRQKEDLILPHRSILNW